MRAANISWSCSPVGPRPRLTHVTDNLARYLHAHPELELADVAHTLQSGRVALAHRRTLIATDRAEAVAALKGRTPSGLAAASSPPVAFLFPGQGAQHLHMAARVYAAEPLFRAELDRAAQLLHSALGLDLRQIVFPAEAETDRAQELLRQTAVAQPALFAVEYALAQVWMQWGVRPDALIGHSVGRVRSGLPVRNLLVRGRPSPGCGAGPTRAGDAARRYASGAAGGIRGAPPAQQRTLGRGGQRSGSVRRLRSRACHPRVGMQTRRGLDCRARGCTPHTPSIRP